MPKVSVIIPVFNHGKFIMEAVQSALSQTFQDFEIVITNDGSTDNTAEVLKKLNDSRIKIFDFERNQGIGMAMNNCIRHASGEYIAHLNADDLFRPEKIEKQVEYLDCNNKVGAVFSFADIIDDNGKKIDNHVLEKIFEQKNRNRFEWLRRFFFEGNCLCHPTAVIRKKIIEEVGLYDGRFHQVQDLELWTRLCMKFNIYIIPEKLASFRMISSEANITGYAPEKLNRANWESAKILEHYLSINIDDLKKVFPEIEKQYGEKLLEDLKTFYLAMIAIKMNQTHFQYFALDSLFRLIKNPKTVEILEKKHNFNYTNFVELTGSIDAFNLIKLRKQ